MLSALLILGVFNLLVLSVLSFVVFSHYRKQQEKMRILNDLLLKLQNSIEPTDRQRKEETIFPLKVQAAERLIVLVERIKPGMIVHRQIANASTASQLAALMLQNIRDEFEYNISQQLYVSELSWQLISAAREEIVQLVHLSMASLEPEAPPEALAREIFTASLRFPDEALTSLRSELTPRA